MIRWMQARRDGRAALVFGCLMFLAEGCSPPSVSSSREEATIHGTVTVKGKLATRGKVYFNPSNINRKDVPTVSVDIGKDGTYRLTSLVGVNLVSITTPVTVKDPVLQYNSVAFNVKGGDNAFEIRVPAPER